MQFDDAYPQDEGYKAFDSSSFSYSSRESGFDRVSKKFPCTICGADGWCGRTKDNRIGLCMRVSAGSFGVARNGANKHHLDQNAKEYAPTVSAVPLRRRGRGGSETLGHDIATPETLNEVYTGLFGDTLALTSEHGDNLMNERGLSDTAIVQNLYASAPTPEQLRGVSEQMRERYGDILQGVPGFYKEETGLWQFRKFGSGFFIPYRNINGLIVGAQFRRDGNAKPKYIWVSTPPKEFLNGTSPGSPLHYVRPDLVRQSNHIVVTEGALKSDCVSQYTNEGYVALAGVTAMSAVNLIKELQSSFPNLVNVELAFDGDFKTNETVRRALCRLTRELENAGYETWVWTWPSYAGKGLDDVYRYAVQGGTQNV